MAVIYTLFYTLRIRLLILIVHMPNVRYLYNTYTYYTYGYKHVHNYRTVHMCAPSSTWSRVKWEGIWCRRTAVLNCCCGSHTSSSFHCTVIVMVAASYGLSKIWACTDTRSRLRCCSENSSQYRMRTRHIESNLSLRKIWWRVEVRNKLNNSNLSCKCDVFLP